MIRVLESTPNLPYDNPRAWTLFGANLRRKLGVFRFTTHEYFLPALSTNERTLHPLLNIILILLLPCNYTVECYNRWCQHPFVEPLPLFIPPPLPHPRKCTKKYWSIFTPSRSIIRSHKRALGKEKGSIDVHFTLHFPYEIHQLLKNCHETRPLNR
jgi:hypothetical protein